MRSLVLLETSGNQRFVFGSGKLKMIEGASALIARLADWFGEASAGRNVETVLAVSGKVVFIADEDDARAVVRAVTTRALDEAPGLDVSGCWLPIEPEHSHSFEAASGLMADVHRLHETQRATRPSAQHRHLQVPHVATCREMGGPSVPGDGDERRRSGRARAVEEAAPEHWRHAVPGTSDIDSIDPRYVAIIHADGNGFGQTFTALGARLANSGVTCDDHLGLVLRVYRALSDLLGASVAAAWDEVQQTLAGAADTDRFRLVVLGGDDLTVVVPGSRGLEVAAAYVGAFATHCRRHLELLNDQPLPNVAVRGEPTRLGDLVRLVVTDGFSATAGVAIVKSGLPLVSAYELADTLCRRAKATGRALRGDGEDPAHSELPGLVDVHAVHDSVMIDAEGVLDSRRGKWLGLHGGPFLVTGSVPLPSVTGLMAAVRTLIGSTPPGSASRPAGVPTPLDRTALIDVLDLAGLPSEEPPTATGEDAPSTRLLQQLRWVLQESDAAGFDAFVTDVRRRRPQATQAVANLLRTVSAHDPVAVALGGQLKAVDVTAAPERPGSRLHPPAPAPQAARYKLSVEFSSPVHVGTGTGNAWLDRSVARLRQGGRTTPYLPAKTVTGDLRAACERAADILDANTEGGWRDLAQELFGRRLADGSNPTPAKQAVRPGLPDTTDVPGRLVRTRAGNAIDEETGVAADDHVAFREVVREGTRFVSHITLDPTCDTDATRVLLQGGAQLLRGIGGRRRRGLGRCVATLLDSDGSTLALPTQDELGAVNPRRRGAAAPAAMGSRQPRGAVPADEDGGEVVLGLSLLTLLPTIADDVLIGNHRRTLGYLPGRLLLPLVHRFLQDHDVELASSWLADGSLRVTDATIAVAGTEPGRLQRCGPAPLAIGAPKQVGGARRLTLLAESSDQLAPLKGWWPIAHPEWAGSAVTVRRIARMHVDATTAEDDGRLYSYEAIDADQLLLAQLTLPGSASGALGGADQAHALWAKWCHAQGEIRLGRSSKDDYGLVQIAAAALEPDPPQIGRRDGDRYTVAWLTSAFTGRDRVGRDAADGTLLGQALLDALPPGAKVRAAVARQARVESWQRSWGLPRPSLPTVAGGSCVLLGLDGPDDDTWRGHLAAAQQRGVGLRRAEGFGSVRFIACEDGGAH